jgi:predicted DNA-binding WGR domain protein/ADP-ribose pyrophosphatase YjhB (NUDIX family)
MAQDHKTLIESVRASLALSRASLALLKAESNYAEAIDKANWNRHPAGSTKGGQFAPKGTSAGPASGGFGGSLFGGGMSAPKQPPKGAKPHPKANDKGGAVSIDYPTKASPSSSWGDAKQTATFVPGGDVPQALNGVPMKSWKAPSNAEGWAKVAGQNPKIDADFPFEPHPTKKTGAGVLILEPDGRVWLTRPTNAFGGYVNTYPKGTAEPGLSLQANAIKEAYEETGLKVRITGVLGDYERDTSKARMYIAQRVGGTPKDMGWESQAIRLAPTKNARQLLNKEHDRAILDDLLGEMGQAVKKDVTGGKPPGKGHHSQLQARWESGSPLGGQWKKMGSDGITMPPTIAGGLAGANSGYQKKANAIHAAAQAGNVAQIILTTNALAPAKAKWAEGAKTSSHVKWNAQLHQYAVQVLADKVMLPKANATAAAITGPAKLSDLTKIGAKPGGSNPGGMYQDASGAKWIVKGSNNPPATEQAKNEVLAAKLMQAVGAGAPDMMLVDLEGQYGGGIGVASKVVDNVKALGSSKADLAAAQADFAVHAWLANYDVIGLSKDNTVIGADGKAINIDPGGALLYRAQGAPKGAAFGDKAVEFNSLRGPVSGLPANPSAWSVYGSMTASQIVESAKKLEAIDDATVKKLVATYGPGTDAQKAALADKIIARKADVLASAKAMEKATAAAAPKPAAQSPTPQATAPAPASAPATPVKEVIFHNTNPGHSKFWAVSVSGNKVVTRYGKIGTAGSVTVKEYANEIDAKVAEVKLANQKQKGGYKYASQQDAPPKVLSALGASQASMAPTPRAAPAAASAPASQPGQPPSVKPVYTDTVPGAAAAWGKLTAAVDKLYASGDADGLNKLLQSDSALGMKIQGAGLNAKNFNAYAQKLLEDLDSKKATALQQKIDGDALTPKAVPQPGAKTANLSSMPVFENHKLPGSNTNAPSHNKKVDQIQAAALAGDAKALLGMNFGSNTYGQKQAKLANDALAALGINEKVAAGQKANTHKALFGGMAPADAADLLVSQKKPIPKPPQPPGTTAIKIDATKLAAKPVFVTSKVDVKKENEHHAEVLHQLARNGDLANLKAYDKFSQQSQKLTQFKQDLVQELEVQLFPPRPKSGVHKNAPPIAAAATPLAAIAAHAQHFQPVKTAKAFEVAAHNKAAAFVILGKTDAKVVESAYTAKGVWKGKLPASVKQEHNAHAQSLPQSVRDGIYKYSTNWAYGANDKMRNKGDITSDIVKVSEAMHAGIIHLPEGTQLRRMMNISGGALKQIQGLQPGDVIQSPQFESTGESGGYGSGMSVEMRMVTTPGVKGLWIGDTIAMVKTEKEVVMPENSRYAINRVYTENGRTIIEALVLPTVKGTLK